MANVKIEKKPRERAYRRWMALAKVALYAPVPIMVGLLGATYVGWLPEGVSNDQLLMILAATFTIVVVTTWMAGRRLQAIMKEWGRRRLHRRGWTE
jgi:hypothetical protein